jgi:hypothetical protein
MLTGKKAYPKVAPEPSMYFPRVRITPLGPAPYWKIVTVPMINPMIPPTVDPIRAPIFTVTELAHHQQMIWTSSNVQAASKLTLVEGRGAVALRRSCNDRHFRETREEIYVLLNAPSD